MRAVFYHHPTCTKSREALDLLRARGIELEVVEYLVHPLTEVELVRILRALGGRPSALLRSNEAPYSKLGLDDDASLGEVASAIAGHPVLMQRALFVYGDRAAIGRPPEDVLAILD